MTGYITTAGSLFFTIKSLGHTIFRNLRIALLFVVASCALPEAFSQCNAVIGANTLEGCETLTIQFNDLSADVSRIWNFGDGSPNVGAQNPIHSFNTKGRDTTYIVTLTITCASGTNSTTKTVKVYAKPKVQFSSDKLSVCAITDSIHLINNSDKAPSNTYLWNFGDGTASSVYAPYKTYSTPGLYNLTLTVENEKTCRKDSTRTQYIKVEQIPSTAFSVNAYSGCSPFNVSFNNNTDTVGTGYSDWTWNFGDGSQLYYGYKPPVHTFTNTGEYTVTLGTKNAIGCYNYSTQKIVVNPAPVALLSASSPACQNENVQIQFTGSYISSPTFTWGFDSPSNVAGSGVGPYSVRWSEAGNKDITLTVTENGCSSSVSTKIQVNPITQVYLDITADNDTICSGQSITFITSPVNYANYRYYINSSLVQNSADNRYIGTGFSNKDKIYAGVTDINGCTQIISDTLVLNVIQSPSISLASSVLNDTICLGTPVTFTASPVGNEEYSFFVGNVPVQTSSNRVLNIPDLANKDRVYAVAKKNGCYSNNSNNIITTVKDVLPIPQVYCGTTTLNSIEFKWDEVPEAIAYEISLDNGANYITPSSGGLGLSHLLTGRAFGETDSIRVRAKDASICGFGIVSNVVSCSAVDCEEIAYNLQGQTKLACEGDPVTLNISQISPANTSISWNGGVFGTDSVFEFTAVNDREIDVSVMNNDQVLCPPVAKFFNILVSPRVNLTLQSSAGATPVVSGTPISFTASPADFTNYAFFDNNLKVQDGPDNVYISQNPVNGHIITVISRHEGCIETSVPITMKVIETLAIPQVNYVYSTEDSIVFSWDVVPGATGYMVSINGETFIYPSSGSTGLTHTVGPLSSGDAATISVKALGDGVSTADSESSQPSIGFAEYCYAFSYSIITDTTICRGNPVTIKLEGLNLSNYDIIWGTLAPTTLKSITVMPLSDTVISVSIRDLNKPFCPRQVSYVNINVLITPQKLVLTSSDIKNVICQDKVLRLTTSPSWYDYYEFYNNGNLITGSTSNFYENNALPEGSNIFKARAVNQTCVGAFSDEILKVVKPPLSVPQINSGTSTLSTISFVWDSIPGALGYLISINNLSYTIPSTGLLGLSHQLTGLSQGDSAKASVIALGTTPCGNSDPSATVTGYANSCVGISYKFAPDLAYCEGEEVNMNISQIAPANYSVSWNGGVYGSDTAITFIGANDTTIAVSVRNQDQLLCPVVSKSYKIKVTKILPIDLTSESPNDTICAGEIISFKISPEKFDKYIFHAGTNVVQDSTISSYLAASLTNGTKIFGEATKNGCSSKSDTITTTIIPAISLSLTASKTGTLCKDELIQFQATAGFDRYFFYDSQSLILESTQNIVSINVNSASITVSAVDHHNCAATGTNTLSYTLLPLPNVTISCSVDTICYGEYANYFGIPSGLSGYRFYQNDTVLLKSGVSNLYATDSLKTGYVISVVGVGSNGCFSPPAQSSFPYIIPYPNSTILSTADGVCLNDSITLIAAKDNTFFGASYYWNTGSTADSIRVSPAYATKYSLYYSTAECKNKVIDSKTIAVDRQTPPIANAGDDVTICILDSVQLEATGGTNFIWRDDPSLDTLTVYNPLAKPQVTTTYYLTTSNSFCSSIDSVKVIVDLCLDDIPDPVPQIITPNGDGINDFWIVYNVDYFENNRVEIYNRWGNLVYQKSPYDNTWEGTNNKGAMLSDGTYYYILDLGNGSPTRSGYIVIHR
jgi:gliding motility-associated-like protein